MLVRSPPAQSSIERSDPIHHWRFGPIPAQPAEVEDLTGQVPATLPFMLDLGIACVQVPPGVPISNLVGLATNGPRLMHFLNGAFANTALSPLNGGKPGLYYRG